MKQRAVILTGASSGIGAATARALAPSSRLLLVARRRERLVALADELRQQGCDCEAHVADLADPAMLPAVVTAAEAAFGAVEALINNAGVFLVEQTVTVDADHVDRQLALNLRAPILLTAAALPALRQSRGQVVNISSVAAVERFAGCGVYAASKAGLEAWTRCLREEERAHGLRVCTIAPGATDTAVFDGTDFDRRRMMRPADVARTVLHVLDTPPSASLEHVAVMPPAGAQ
ncbi:MAG: SDR family NAD(P)-dependent oxidoreductase [Planctomycetota bacterium]